VSCEPSGPGLGLGTAVQVGPQRVEGELFPAGEAAVATEGDPSIMAKARRIDPGALADGRAPVRDALRTNRVCQPTPGLSQVLRPLAAYSRVMRPARLVVVALLTAMRCRLVSPC
jgi:hypothetical protein